MNKMRALHDLEKRNLLPRLTDDALRLYLLLLAACSDGGEGVLSLATVKEAIGRDRFRTRLARACSCLKEIGLIETTDEVSRPGAARRCCLHFRLHIPSCG